MRRVWCGVCLLGSMGLIGCEGDDRPLMVEKNVANLAEVPKVPSVLSSNPDDPNWVFEGYAKALDEQEKERRRQYNDYIRTLSDKEYVAYKSKRKAERKAEKRAEAALNGKTFDERDDLYVALLPNNQVWRKKVSLRPVDAVGTMSGQEPRGQPEVGVISAASIKGGNPLQWDEKEEARAQWDAKGPGVLVEPAAQFCPFSDCQGASLESDPEEIPSYDPSAGSAGPAGSKSPIAMSGIGSITAVFGSDTRRLVSAYTGYSLTSYPWRTQGMFTNSSQSDSNLPIDLNCSGTKIAARVVVTAGHCLYDGGWSSGAARWYPGPDGIDALMSGGDPTPNGYKGWVAHLVHSDWYDDGDYKDDMGWHVLLDNQSSCNLGWLGYADESGLNNDTVNIYGAPGERQRCAASPESHDYCYGSIYGTSGKVTRARVSSIRYKIDTSPGQSGSGVYKYYSSSGNRYVVAVHSGKWDSDENYACRMNNNKFDMTSGIVDDYPSSYCD